MRQSFAAVLAVLMALAAASAQTGFSVQAGTGPTIHGVPPSVTSFGFGGSPGFHGVPPSVTSLNFGSSPAIQANRFQSRRSSFGQRRANRSGFANPFYGSAVVVPYYLPSYEVMEPGVDDSMEQMEPEDYRGGPTVFDRRGPGIAEYARPAPARETQRMPQEQGEQDYRVAALPADARPPDVAPQLPTVLVFKDGHQQEISNYAIVGPMLYELSEGRARKVALAELDLAATVKENDSRGVDFQVPASVEVN
jgi:hypothetical protein